jgi:hypothetical protein
MPTLDGPNEVPADSREFEMKLGTPADELPADFKRQHLEGGT